MFRGFDPVASPQKIAAFDVEAHADLGTALKEANLAIIMNNHALFSQNTANMVVFDIFVDDRAEPLAQPRLP